MTLRTSLVIAGDASSAVAALDQTEASLGQASASAAQLAAAYANADRAIDQLAAAQVTAKAQTAAAKASFDAGEISLREYSARLIETKSALSLVEAGHRAAVGEIRKLSTANDQVAPSFRQAQAGAVNFGRNVQDVAVQLQSGANIGTIVAQQGGQIADAVAQMGGRFSGLAQFLAGPWGAAIIVGTGVVLNLVQSMWQASDAAEENEQALTKLGNGADFLRLSTAELTKAISELEQAQRRQIRSSYDSEQAALRDAEASLKAATAKRQQAIANLEAFKSTQVGAPVGVGIGAGLGPLLANTDAQIAQLQVSQGIAEKLVREAQVPITVRQAEAAGDPRKAIQLRYDKEESALRENFVAGKIAADDYAKSLTALTAKREADLTALNKHNKGRKDTAAERLQEYGEDTATRIANIGDRFRDLPGPVQQANKALRELDDIASDLDRKTKKPANIEELRSGLVSAKAAIEASLLKPFDDYLAKSREAAEIDKLLIAGRDDEAAALRVVLGLKDKMKPLDQERLAAVLATVQAERARALVLRDQRALIDANIRAVHDMRGALEQTVADALRGRFSIDNILRSIANSYINITSQRIVEKLFGDTLRSIEQQATGADKVDSAATQIGKSLESASSATLGFADVVRKATGSIAGIGITAVSGGAKSAGLAIAAGAASVRASNDNYAPTGEPADIESIIVEGRRKMGLPGMDAGSLLFELTTKLLGNLGTDIPKVVGGAVKDVLKALELSVGDAIGGAITGASASRIILGDRGTGGTIGSSVGGILGDKIGEKVLTKGFESIAKGLGSFAGPVGSIVGGLVGGLIGGLFKKAPSAGAVITDTSSTVSVTGNSDASKQAVSTVSGALQSSIKQIAKQLGGELGQFAVAIGQREDYYRVAGVATDAVSAKHPERGTGVSLLYNGTDANAALAAALANAIADGAVKGLSPKVEKALKSSTNIDDALAEALKVQDLELALGGVRGAIEKEFRTFEASAKERLRIAKAYGFDLVEVEALNGRERLALSEKLLKQQTGSLQNLIDEITSGSLFEGSAVDRRDALLTQIAGARADAEAGKDGAADTLAKLLQDLNTVSKEVYGTTGRFAADQAAILDAARDSIAKANQRIQEAQQAVTQAVSDPALAETNQQLDETNDQLAKIAAAMNVSVDYLKAIAANGNGTPNYAELRRLAGY